MQALRRRPAMCMWSVTSCVPLVRPRRSPRNAREAPHPKRDLPARRRSGTRPAAKPHQARRTVGNYRTILPPTNDKRPPCVTVSPCGCSDDAGGFGRTSTTEAHSRVGSCEFVRATADRLFAALASRRFCRIDRARVPVDLFRAAAHSTVSLPPRNATDVSTDTRPASPATDAP